MSDSERSDVDARFAEIIAHWDDTPLRAAEVESRVEPADRAASGEVTPTALAPDPMADRWPLRDDPPVRRGLPDSGASTPPTSDPLTHDVDHHAPETRAPETHAPQTHAPETHAPETHAPETHAPLDGAPVDRRPPDGEPVDQDLGRPFPPAPPGAEESAPAWRAPTGRPGRELEPEDHFEPPTPAPLPAGDLHFWGIVVGLCGGPLLLLYLIVFDRDAGSLWTAAAILLTLGGFGLLVARQPHRRPDDGDDGARL